MPGRALTPTIAASVTIIFAMSASRQRPAAASRLHRDDARREPFGEGQKALASHPSSKRHLPNRIETNQAASVLAKIDAQNRNRRHASAPFPNSASSRMPEGGAGHSLISCRRSSVV